MKRFICFLIAAASVFSFCCCGSSSSSSSKSSYDYDDYEYEYEDYEYEDEDYEDEYFDVDDCWEFYETPESSCFSYVGYNWATETLYLDFRTSGEYYYYDFSEDDWDMFINADSLGSWFNTDIKGWYDYDRIG